MNHQPQLERIRAMEQALNESAAAVELLQASLEHYEAVLPQLRSLEEYYESPLWLQDYDDDNAGKLPPDLCRGVLTEDALYDLLCDHDRLRKQIVQLASHLLPQNCSLFSPNETPDSHKIVFSLRIMYFSGIVSLFYDGAKNGKHKSVCQLFIFHQPPGGVLLLYAPSWLQLCPSQLCSPQPWLPHVPS